MVADPPLQYLEQGATEDLICPLSGSLMTDPVLGSDGVTYQRTALDTYIAEATKIAWVGEWLCIKG